MQLDEKYLPAITTLLAALIGAVVSFIITVLSKEQKISEFRQQWIDALRNDLSEYASQLGMLHIAFKAATNPEGKFEIERFLISESAMHEAFIKVGILVNRIRLRLNPVEHKIFISKLNALESGALKSENWEGFLGKLDDVLKDSQTLLKTEWEIVKAGEKSFKRIKTASKISALIFLTLIAATVFWSLIN